jgi:acetyltransferase-like isoleucine patch superfamily enzyme
MGDALKFPIIIYGPCRLRIGGGGNVRINKPVKTGILKIGYRKEIINYSIPSQFRLFGTLVLKGEVHLASAVTVYVREGATLEMGHLSFLGAFGNLICTKHIVFSDYSWVGAQSVVTDSNYHYMKQLNSGNIYRKEREVIIGSRNWIGLRSALLPGTKTPDNITIAFGTVCNRDYTKDIPENSVIAGVPAKLVKENTVCIFDFEKEKLINEYFETTDFLIYNDNEIVD